MFKKVLIAEDVESASISLRVTVAELGIPAHEYVYYCDDALLRLKKELQSGSPFDLLITDLSFAEDHRVQQIAGGVALIIEVKRVQPDLKILVFSGEDRAAVVDSLFKQLGIQAYVCKARNDVKELKLAIEAIYKNKTYISTGLKPNIKQKNAYEFTEFDIAIITQLAAGTQLQKIPDYLQQNNIKPSSLSSVEKRLSYIKEVLEFSKNEQLIAYCKDFGII